MSRQFSIDLVRLNHKHIWKALHSSDRSDLYDVPALVRIGFGLFSVQTSDWIISLSSQLVRAGMAAILGEAYLIEFADNPQALSIVCNDDQTTVAYGWLRTGHVVDERAEA